MTLCKELQKTCYPLVNARKGLPTQLGPWGVLASKTVWKGGEGVAKGSMVGPVFFNVYLDFFVCIRKVSAYSFTDDSILSSFAKSVKMLLEIPITESKNDIKWFSDNKIIVNDDKFKSIIIQKSNSKKQ